MNKNILIFLFWLFCSTAFAQLAKPVTWSYYVKKITWTEAAIFIKAKISGNWHIYAQAIKSEPMKLKFNYNSSKDFSLIGKTIEPKATKKYDNTLKIELVYFEKEVVFTQKIKLNKLTTIVKAKVEFMVCNDKQCLPWEEVLLNIPLS